VYVDPIAVLTEPALGHKGETADTVDVPAAAELAEVVPDAAPLAVVALAEEPQATRHIHTTDKSPTMA
jgi:hypothetical protein